jgi:hypothetical protein
MLLFFARRIKTAATYFRRQAIKRADSDRTRVRKYRAQQGVVTNAFVFAREMYNDFMLSRAEKQTLIGIVYLLIAGVIASGIYWAKFRPTCFDGVKNGQEEGVDCGTLACGKACVAPVQAVQVQNVQLVKTPAGDFDMAALVYNPNTDYGADMIDYTLVITDSYDQQISSQNSSFYILPGQTKYIVQTSLRDIPDKSTARVIIKDADWQKVGPGQNVNFIVGREATTLGANQTTYQAVITNQSNFDFDTIDISVVVFDSSGALMATNLTNFQTFLAKTDRSIQVSWPFALPVGVRIQTEVGTNVFNNDNFLKTNGTQEKFQQYY